jgi:hypothetical protein
MTPVRIAVCHANAQTVPDALKQLDARLKQKQERDGSYLGLRMLNPNAGIFAQVGLMIKRGEETAHATRTVMMISQSVASPSRISRSDELAFRP